MESSYSNITLHPEAGEFLFLHYRSMVRIFTEVLGLFELDYIAIALLTPEDKLLFLSSRPSIECNLIENDLWQFDASIQKNFFLQDKLQLWETLYDDALLKPLRHYKQVVPKLSMGISIPGTFEEYRVVYSFALKSTDKAIQQNAINNIEALVRLGHYCLQNITKKIPLPDRKISYSRKKPSLTLIINNEKVL
jgi:hypothetical protein